VSAARKLVLSGIALTALLALVSVASRAHRPGGGSGATSHHAPTLLADYLGTIALLTVPLGAIVVVWAMTMRRRRDVLEGRSNWRRTLVSLGVLMVLLAAGVFARTHFHRDQQGQTVAAIKTPPKPARQAPPSKSPSFSRRAHFQWLPALVLGSIVLAFGVAAVGSVMYRRRYGAELDEAASLAAALDAVLADTLDDLRAERDPRRAVIRAYARMEQTFAAYGVPRRRSEAPVEYLTRVLESISIGSHSVRRLTDLYERAKFSDHEIGSQMKDDAIETLAGLRAELEHGQAAA